jgi:hypothetical protein
MGLIDTQRASMEQYIHVRFHNARSWEQMRQWVDSLSTMPSAKEMTAHTVAPYSVRDMVGMIETRPCRGVSPLVHACRRQPKCMTAHQNCWYNAANQAIRVRRSTLVGSSLERGSA